jgi:hypothetical protein
MYCKKKHSSATNNICFNFKNTCPSQMGENLYMPIIKCDRLERWVENFKNSFHR